MTREEAHEIVRLVEASYSFDLGEQGRKLWTAAIVGYDADTGMEAAVMCARTMSRRPTLKDLTDYMAKIRRDRGDESWRDQDPEAVPPPPWVLGWALSRYRDGDMRLWPEQQSGYRETGQTWDPANVMPDDEQERYKAEGASLPMKDFWKLVGGRA
jgi:hypothetical protein